MSTLLRVEGLSVNYGPVSALRGVSLEVEEGRLTTVIGPNGAGKSTLLWTISGVLRPASGSVTLKDTSIVGMAPEEIVKRGAATSPEGRHVIPSLTVAENLTLARRIGKQRGAAKELYDRTLERFPVLAKRLSSPAGQLSGGEAQQLVIGRALLMKPDVLLLDEPSFGLAPLVVESVFNELTTLRDDGMTILLVEQNAHKALEAADYAYVLNRGRVETSAPASELLTRADFVSAYFGNEAAA